MALTNKLMNPTPYEVKLPYNRGVKLTVPSDGELQVTMEQMADFREGQPGSEEVRKTLDYHGLFLFNSDLSYDIQAFNALQASVRTKKEMRREFIERLKNNRLQAGRPADDDTIEEAVESSGWGVNHKLSIGAQIEKLEARTKLLITKLQDAADNSKNRETFDLTKTFFGLDQPKEFPSTTAMEMFMIDQEANTLEKHNAFIEAASE